MNFSSLTYIILFVILIVIFIIIFKFNTIIRVKNRVNKASSNISVCLNKRFDLIPNIVECVKSYSKYEDNTLEKITSLRSNYKEQTKMNIETANKVNGELTKYLAIVENYPELKANEQYLDLQKQLRDIEDELGLARNRYNDEATIYNTTIEVVPNNIVASIFGFKRALLFSIDESKKENINIKDTMN